MAGLSETNKQLEEALININKLKSSLNSLSDSSSKISLIEDAFRSLNNTYDYLTEHAAKSDKMFGGNEVNKVDRQFKDIITSYRELIKELNSGINNTSTIDDFISKAKIYNAQLEKSLTIENSLNNTFKEVNGSNSNISELTGMYNVLNNTLKECIATFMAFNSIVKSGDHTYDGGLNAYITLANELLNVQQDIKNNEKQFTDTSFAKKYADDTANHMLEMSERTRAFSETISPGFSSKYMNVYTGLRNSETDPSNPNKAYNDWKRKQLDELGMSSGITPDSLSKLGDRLNYEGILSGLKSRASEVGNTAIDIKVNTSEAKDKIKEIKTEVDKIDDEPIKIKAEAEKIDNFRTNEEALKQPLYDTMKYVMELSRMLNSISKSAHNNGSSTNSANIEDYFASNSSSVLPYGVTVKSHQIKENDDGEDEYDLDFGVDSKKLAELGDEYRTAVLEFVEFLNNFKTMTKVMGKSALNNADPYRMISSTTGEVFDKFKDYIQVSNTQPNGLENVDYIQRNGQYISQIKTPESAEAHRGNAELGIDGLGLFTKTVAERYLGYEENGEHHAGYKESMEKLNGAALQLFDSFSKLAAFIPALSQTPEAFNTFLYPESETSLFGQDIFKRLTYMTKYSSMDYDGPIQSPSDVPLQDLLGFSELRIPMSKVLSSLEGNGISTPTYDESSSIIGENITKLLIDESRADIAKIVNSVDKNTFKQDNFDELSDEEKKAATVISDFRANLATTANTIKLLATESANTTSVIPTEGQVEFDTSYKGSKSRSGAVIAYNKARTEVDDMDKKLSELDLRMKQIETMFSSGNLVGLTSPDEFEGLDPVSGLSKSVMTLMDRVVQFSKSELSKSAQKENAQGEKMFDPSKYINKLTEYADKLNSMSQSEQFKVMTSSDGLKDLDTAIKNVERIKTEQKQASAKDKLGNALITSSLQQFALEKELVARESASNSGLLSGVELDKNNARINAIKSNLESLRKNIAEANSEAEKSGIHLESEIKLANNLKNSYNQVATALGSMADADIHFNRLFTATSAAEIDNIVKSVEKLGHLAGDINFSKGILGGNKYKELVKSGSYERELLSKLVNPDKLRGDDLSIAKFSNMAYSQLIRDTQKLQTGNENPFANQLNNINVSDLKEGIQKTTDSLKAVSAKIAELESTGLVNSELVSYKDKLRQMQNQLDTITSGLNNSSGIGELRLAFEKAKNLGITIDGLNDKLAQLELDAKFKQVKNYVADQNAIRLSQGKSVMTGQEEVDYYASQLTKFAEGTREYIEILKLKNQAEAKAANETQARAAEQARAQQEAIKSLMEETKSYVSTQEALSGQKMSFSDQAAYYEQQANKMKQLAGESKEYIEILKIKRQAEYKAAEEAQKAAEIEKKAQEDAVKAARDRVNNTLGTIKKIADGVNSAVNKIVSIIRNGINLINKVFSTIGRFVGKITTGAKAIVSLFGSLSNRVRGTASDSNRLNGSFNILAGTATELRSKIMLLKGAFDTLFNNQLVKKAENLMASVYSLKNIAGGGVTQEVLDWANSMEYAFGISAKELIGDINELTGVLYGLGMTAEDTAVGSENLLMMSRYLAFMGAAGGDAKTVMTKLVSGMKGMTQAIDDLGLSVRDAQMNSFLESLKAQGGEFANIATDFSSLNEEARVYVRYAALINQFTKNYDITNFAKALDTVTGRMQIMKQTAASLVTTIGTGLTKAISKLAIFIIPLLKTIEAAVTNVFAFFGIDVSMTTDINEGTDAVDDLNGGLDKTKDKLDKVDKSANKAKGSLQSFDRVNNVTSSSSSKSDSDSDGFDYKKLMTSMLGDLNALAEEASKSFADKMQEKMQEAIKNMRKKFLQFAKDITGRADFDLGFDWTAIKENLKKIIDNIKTFIESWGKFFITIGLKIADDINIGAIITKFTELVAKVTEVANTISEVLQPALDIFYEVGIKPIMEYLGIKTLNIMDLFIDKLDELAQWFVDNEDTVNKFFEDLGEKVAQAFRVLTRQQTLDDLLAMNDTTAWGTFLIILKSISSSVDDIKLKFKELGEVLTGKISLDTLVDMKSMTVWGDFLLILSSIIDIVKQLGKTLYSSLKTDVLPWLKEKLDQFALWISENKDKIVELINKIAGIAWDGFKIFVDLVGKLIDFVVKNPDSVYGFFAGLLGLKVASWFTDVATSIGLAVVGMEGFTKLISGGALGKLFGVGAKAAATTAATTATTGGALTAETLTATAGTLGATATGGATAGAGGAAAAGSVALGPILAVIAAIVALIAVVKDLWDTSEGFRESVSNAWEYIKNAFNSAKEAIAPAIESLKEAWSTFYESYESSGLKDILDVILSFVVEVLGGTLSIAISTVGRAIALIIDLLGEIIVVIAGVIDVVSGFIKIIIGIFTLDGDMIKEGWGELVTGLVEIVSGLIQAIVDIIGNVGGLILDIGKNIFGGLFEGMSEAWNTGVENVKAWFNSWIDSIKEFFGIHSPSTLFAEFGSYIVQGLLQGIQGMWQTLVTGVTTLCTTFIDSVKKIILTIINVGTEIVKGILSGITSTWQTLVSGVTSLATSFISSVKTILLSIRDVGSTLVNSIWSGISSAWSGLTSKVSGLCSNLVNSIKSTLSTGWNNMSNWLDNTKNSISTGWNKMTGRTTASTAKTVTSHAVGGSIGGGQLFIANENGQPELIGNIDGSPKTNVANNNMIIEAMTDGVFTGVYNALAEVSNQRGNVGGGATNAKIEINGFGLIDSSTLSELARLLAPYNNSNNTNIADVNFSI